MADHKSAGSHAVMSLPNQRIAPIDIGVSISIDIPFLKYLFILKTAYPLLLQNVEG